MCSAGGPRLSGAASDRAPTIVRDVEVRGSSGFLTEQSISVVRAGRIDYLDAWNLQRALARARRGGDVPDLALLLEHPPTYTTGWGGDRGNLLIDDARLREVGAVFHAVDRGGDMTFHGPGQIVVYVIVDLGRFQRSVRRYVRLLEETVITSLQPFGVVGSRHPSRPGVWVGDRKIAAIGVAISRGVSFHGFALNVDPDLRYFDYMIPCGIRDAGVTSIVRETGAGVSIRAAEDEIVRGLSTVFGTQIDENLTYEDLCHVATARLSAQR